MLVAECSNRGRRRAQATASSEAGTVATGTAAVWIRLRGTASPRSTIPPADVGYRADKEHPIFNNSRYTTSIDSPLSPRGTIYREKYGLSDEG